MCMGERKKEEVTSQAKMGERLCLFKGVQYLSGYTENCGEGGVLKPGVSRIKPHLLVSIESKDGRYNKKESQLLLLYL